MLIQFDPAKDTRNREKHGISLGDAGLLDWETAVIWPDDRCDYGEDRMRCLGYIGTRLHFVAFVDRHDIRRIITLRKANKREEQTYARA